MKLTYSKHQLHFWEPFKISRYTLTEQQIIIASLGDDQFTGFGEATTNPYYNVTASRLESVLEQVKDFLSHYRFTFPASLWEDLHNIFPEENFALSMLDCAAHDFYGRVKGNDVMNLLCLPASKPPLTSYTIGIDTIKNRIRKIKTFPWPIYKIKMEGKESPDVIYSLREHTAAPFYIDANASWNAEQTVEYSRVFKNLNVLFMEQPLPAEDWQGMEYVKRHTEVPVIADESCVAISDVDKCAGVFHGINVKLLKCGGITPALEIIERAKKLELQVMIGCMTESSVGITAAAQLLSLADYADLDGPLLMKNDIANGVRFHRGLVQYPEGNGLGIQLKNTRNE